MSPHNGAAKKNSPAVYLLPGFDEFLIAYKDRSAVLDDLHKNKWNPGSNGMLNPIIVVNGRVVGTWKRILKKDSVLITTAPFASLNKNESRALVALSERYGKFLGMRATLGAEK